MTCRILRFVWVGSGLCVLAVAVTGCGTIKGQTATDQLLISDAVDQTLSQMEFSELANKKVYLDTQYVRNVRTAGFVDSSYIVSSMRELMVRDGCLVQEHKGNADVIVEVRIGALGTDNHEVNYGIPGSSTLNRTATLLASSPLLPSIPEISLARKDERRAAAKIAVFAYYQESREPAWETGTMLGQSHAKSTWILGAGPFQEGSIFRERGPSAQGFIGETQLTSVPLLSKLAPHRSRVALSENRFTPDSIEAERSVRNPLRVPPSTMLAGGEEPVDRPTADSPTTETRVVQASASVPISTPGDDPTRGIDASSR